MRLPTVISVARSVKNLTGSDKTVRHAVGHSVFDPLHRCRRTPEESMYRVASPVRISGRWFTPYQQDPPAMFVTTAGHTP